MGRVVALLRPLWVRLGVVVVVCAVAGTLVVTVGRPALFTAAATSAASSDRGYHCHPHPTPHATPHGDDRGQNATNQTAAKGDGGKHTGGGDSDKHDSCKP